MDDFVGTDFKIDTRYNGVVTHTVVGISDERWSGVKVYLVSCGNCSKDKEMYPSGVFKIVKSSLKKGQCCCGCSSRQKTEYEQKLVLTRECEKRGYIFKGFPSGYKGVVDTSFSFYCPIHQKYYLQDILSFLNIIHGCSDCRYQSIRDSDTDHHIQEIMTTGNFSGCTFTRNENRETPEGDKRFFDMTCPVCSVDEYVKAGVCDGVFTSQMSPLKRGNRSCRCTGVYRWTREQREYQINKICLKKGFTFGGWLGGKESYANSLSCIKWTSDLGKENTSSITAFIRRFWESSRSF